MHPQERAMRRLAVAVIRLAVRDAAGLIEKHRYAHTSDDVARARDQHHGSQPRRDVEGRPLTREGIQREALAWLSTPSPELDAWCEVLGIDDRTLIDGLDGAIEHAKRASRMKGTS